MKNKLTRKQLQEVRSLNLLIQHHKLILQTLEARMRNVVKDATGLDTEMQNVHLDLETGRLDASTAD